MQVAAWFILVVYAIFGGVNIWYGGHIMDEYVSSSIWCQLDSLRFVIEHNPGSVVILVGMIGFLFWRLQRILQVFYLWLVNHTPFGRRDREKLAACKKVLDDDKRYECVVDAYEQLNEKISRFFEFLLNFAALALLTLGGVIIYLIFHPPVSCAATADSNIFIPAVFKQLYSKDGELLYVDEKNSSYVRVWNGIGSADPSSNQTSMDLRNRYLEKIADAQRHMVGKKPETDIAPEPGRNYFVVSWRDRDDFDVYFVSRLIEHRGKSHIDSLEITSPVHGNALMKFDYQILFCSFVQRSTSNLPTDCRHFFGHARTNPAAQTQNPQYP